ncbi:type I secretion protein TolC [Pseudoduganella lutea]|uniref:Type I secretion protein TolC n=2 Tax=Pseudoduganella lutea TaxID=321985 RepID=A0A4P6L753_9BURK|nr:type I secretion protein TolC [Pseudoduganella lutea]
MTRTRKHQGAAVLRRIPVLLGTALLLHGGAASALGLMQAYQAALQNDPAFRAAFYTAEAGREYQAIGRSALLPTLSASVSGSKSHTVTSFPGSTLAERDQHYIARSKVVQLRQPLISLDALARYKQGKAQTNYSVAQFDSQQQEVIVRVAAAYFEVLFQQDQLALAEIERDMYVEQRKVNDLLFAKGEGTKTDAIETQSRLDLAEAKVLEGQDNVLNARTTLAGIIGGDVDALDPMRPGFRVAPADTLGFDEWKRTAMENNPDIKALQYGIEIARQEFNKARAGHTPRLDLVGSYQKSESDSVNTINQNIDSHAIGFQLNIPLYNGGAISAQARQAAANKSKAEEDLQAQIDKTLTALRKDYNTLTSSVRRIDALVKAVDSANLLVKATEQSIKGGVRINLDLLNAKRQLYTAQRDLAQARYGYLQALLRMRAAAGVLSVEDLRMVAAYFD